MSRVSITGTKRVMDDAVRTIHRLDLLHMSDYAGSWEGFEPGDPAVGAEEAAEQLVTVRSLQSILGIDAENASADERSETGDGPSAADVPGSLDPVLEDVRDEVNALDDRRDELDDERRATVERIESMAPIEALGIDLDLLGGYDTLETRVGEGDSRDVERALDGNETVAASEVFAEDEAVAVFARPAAGEHDVLEEALVGVEFAPVEIPDAEGSPEAYVAEREERLAEIERELDSVDAELDEARENFEAFLLAAEEHLAIELQRREAPLSFATTAHAFVAEGWIPTERVDDLAEGLAEAVGEHVAVEELERADYDEEGRLTGRESTESEGGPPAATDGGWPGGDGDPHGSDADDRSAGGDSVAGDVASDDCTTDDPAADDPVVRPDGGREEDRPMATGEPPVVQDNPGPVRPFETLLKLVDRPTYAEFDPTVVLFLTFPALFGFMIGDLGYGTLYLLISYAIYSRFDSTAVRGIGAVGMWAGGFTMLFGVLYGEVFGLHQLGELLWGTGESAGLLLSLGHPPLEKGLSPAAVEWAQLWVVVSLLFGLLHLTIGYVIAFVETLRGHGLGHAAGESGSWLLMMLGLWVWIFSTSAEGLKPSFLFDVFSGEPFALGFAGFPATVGLAGAGVYVLGLLLLLTDEPVELVEFAQGLVNVLSYARLAAVLLAKAGLAFVVNLLVFGAYQHEEEFHFLFFSDRYASPVEVPAEELMFAGLINGEGLALVGGAVAAVLVFVVGHLIVLGLGLTSAGLQAIRLEFVEFLSKSRAYEGGGEAYEPFGRERVHTTED
ncbi:V-type ATP synthase subunit I [Halobacteriales archaeon QS_4_69_34]|nr:MAG: V-type ATP synthase subunit I [Halobacteriales archaeon QS_4_69_34]